MGGFRGSGSPGKCHEKQEAPEGGRSLSRAPPHCVRTLPLPHVPQGTGLCLTPSSPMAPCRRAEMWCPGLWGHYGHRGVGGGCECCTGPSSCCGAWQWLPVHLAACCCILLFPCSALERGGRALSGLEALGVPPPQGTSPEFHLGPPCRGHVLLHQLLWGIRGHGLLALAQSLAELSSPGEETLGGQMWESGQGLAATEATPHNVRCV